MGAILGFGHQLLHLSSYNDNDRSMYFVRGHSSENPDLLLAQAQSDGPNGDLAWGLRLQESGDTGTILGSRHGLINYRRPWHFRSQKIKINEDEAIEISHAMTYVQDRSLVQVVTCSGAPWDLQCMPIRWTLGGNIQLGKRTSSGGDDDNTYEHRAQLSEDGFVLTCSVSHDSNLLFRVDVELSVNGTRQKLQAPKELSAQGAGGIDITQIGSVEDTGAIIVARFTPNSHQVTQATAPVAEEMASRNGRTPTSKEMPTWTDIKKLFGFDCRTKNSLDMALKWELGGKSGHKLRRLITHSVERLLHHAVALPNPPEPGSPGSERYLLINNLVAGDEPRINYEASL